MSRLSRLFEQFRPAAATRDQSGVERSEIRWMVMGLGNPGEQYQRSRHNLGFMAVHRFAARYNGELTRRKFNGFYTEIRAEAGNAIVIMPQTFYNRSGDCASAMLGYYKVPPERLVVIHDEMDLPERQLRLKRGGGDAGNRGVRSITEALGTPDFIRVRIGIAHPGGSQGSIDYLLQPLTDDELHSLEPVFERAGDAVLAVMRDGLDRARSIYNQRV
ncbi:MAG: aminoacyl-tRNA hydrolase [Deltaproteobacteria bacterium]|nr:aminoacyl-tRNA hydrolase [Deltaproteobacteria bacterium]